MEKIRAGEWKDNVGKIPNPGQSFFLQLANAAGRYVKNQRNADGISYERKEMVMTAMELNKNSLWEERQLTPNYKKY